MPIVTDREWMRIGFASFMRNLPSDMLIEAFVPWFWDQLFDLFTAQ